MMELLLYFIHNDLCEGEIEVEYEWNPPELYGSDADGNRGIWINGYFELITDECPLCKKEFTKEDKDAIIEMINDYHNSNENL